VIATVLTIIYSKKLQYINSNSHNFQSSRELFHYQALQVNANASLLHQQRILQDNTLKFDEVKTSLQRILDLIYNRYELDTAAGKFFYTTQNFASNSWDIYKYRFAKKIAKGGDSYLMIFGGSSVTAGHDNTLASSFPMIVEKRLKDVFAALQIKFNVSNIAQGANNCYPYEMCYESMGGDNPDFVGWEQSYNCGHDLPSFEITARVAGLSANRGSVYYSASGAWLPNSAPISTHTPPYCEEEWTVESVQAPFQPLKHWYPTESDLVAQKNKLNDFYKAKASYGRFLPTAYNRFLAPSGFNVWEANPLCEVPLPDGKVKSKCCGADAEAFNLNFFTKEAARYDLLSIASSPE
jgi:hypothetical protein